MLRHVPSAIQPYWSACAVAHCRQRALLLVSRRCRQLLCSPQLLHSVDVTI